MKFAQTRKIKFIDLLSVILFVLAIVSCFCQAQDQRSTLGELKLEGQHVERLVLQRKDGQTERFNRPGESIELPVGQYRLLESHLNGGYYCFQGAGPQSKWVTIAENAPAVLKIGAPLNQTLTVKRQGKVLTLDYKLIGIGGEAYTIAERSNPPSLTVYRGDQEIASGQFAYG